MHFNAEVCMTIVFVYNLDTVPGINWTEVTSELMIEFQHLVVSQDREVTSETTSEEVLHSFSIAAIERDMLEKAPHLHDILTPLLSPPMQYPKGKQPSQNKVPERGATYLRSCNPSEAQVRQSNGLAFACNIDNDQSWNKLTGTIQYQFDVDGLTEQFIVTTGNH